MEYSLKELKENAKRIEEEAQDKLASLNYLDECEDYRIEFLGRSGKITVLFESIKGLPDEDKPNAGRILNKLKNKITQLLKTRKEALLAKEKEQKLKEEAVDVTLPGRPVERGSLHLSTQTLREIYKIFAQMGFQVFRSREVETDEYNFGLLNMPPHHPAREMWDTLYIDETRLLRTHTSPGQIRAMRKYAPDPIRIILPGKCYRYEQVTARSEMMFYQVEGLAVGENITMADLKGVLGEFARQMFGETREVRFRASYFPFTEPSAEVDMDCILCGGKGCRVCKYTGWVEILGSGMVHPQVLKNGGYDPEKYSGFAFGMGPERIAMLNYDIDDIRHFFRNDLRFLKQFR
jgi:phenylalanyl-tRNA synthetase alpha chain